MPATSDPRVLTVHRCRTVEYTPAAIVALAYTPDSVKSAHAKLACARSNGDIELWSPTPQSWHLERTIPGAPNAPAEAVVWTHQTTFPVDASDASESAQERAQAHRALRAAKPRLFSAGLNGKIVEHDTTTLLPKQSIASGGGAVWSLAVDPSQSFLVAGCEDGFLRLFDISSPTSLEYLSIFERQDGRILSVAWHPDGKHLVTGGADGCIRILERASRRCVRRFTVQTVRSGDDTIVWDVKILKDGTIVSGESTGNVSFWNWETGTLLHSFKVHGADVLCLVADKAGKRVFSSGVDRKICQFRLTDLEAASDTASVTGKKKKTAQNANTWVRAGEKRYHSNDVRAMVLIEQRPNDALVTGGIDTDLIFSTPVADFPFLTQYRMPPFPHSPIISLSRASRLLMCRFSDHVKVWKLGTVLALTQNPRTLPNHTRVDFQKETLLLHIKPKCATNLCASAISEDGQWIAVSDMESVKLFKVTHSDKSEVRKARTFPSPALIPAAHALAFTPDSLRLIVAGIDSTVTVVDLSTPTFSVEKRFTAHRGQGDARARIVDPDGEDVDLMDVDGFEGADANGEGISEVRGSRGAEGPEMVCSLAVSADGMWLASGDRIGRIFVFNLDSLKHHATLPRFDSPHTSLSFHAKTPTLVVTCTSNEFFMYDCERRDLTDWSRENSRRLPYRWLLRKDIVMGAAVDPAADGIVTLWGASSSCFVDLEKPLGPRDAVILLAHRKAQEHKKRLLKEATDTRPQSESRFLRDEDRKAADIEDVDLARASADVQRRAESKKVRAAAAELERTQRVSAPITLVSAPTAGTKRALTLDQDPSDDETTTDRSAAPLVRLEGNRPRHAFSDTTCSESFQMDHRYSPLMFLGFVAEGEMVVVERPILKILETLPAGFAKREVYRGWLQVGVFLYLWMLPELGGRGEGPRDELLVPRRLKDATFSPLRLSNLSRPSTDSTLPATSVSGLASLRVSRP
ncbi:quinon protein alcohol dehydrogenase-like superfamily [Blyttiomyces helicus]|uniref:Quinon protein alcohol dehydrogenase-like superfamily n=1 Tax=Blyttiomyces helicus TaxID=388810 RepID=A0A4P9WER0_9FUNG|nr:quinon protein alcohol dehydrogenase-like superfamily [Blyttiomyces helicus]|eukprot:RKO91094.1 quinon protein alcohol dehydrogenase-like superfamily [Blyttiomyces helicus]